VKIIRRVLSNNHPLVQPPADGYDTIRSGHIKEPAKIISCDDEAATEEARQMPNGADQTLEVWQSDQRVTVIGLKNRVRNGVRERGQ